MNDDFNLGDLPEVILKPKKEDPVRGGHPWIFSKALESSPTCKPGTLVKVKDSHGRFVGLGSFHPGNSIRVRIFTRVSEPVDLTFFSRRIENLYNTKRNFLPPDTNGFRIVHGDADSLPGLVVDIYDKTLVFQITTAGMEPYRPLILKALVNLFNPEAVVERSDLESRKEEGLQPLPVKIHYGAITSPVVFREAGISLLADPLGGQKTGFFLDQRELRGLVREYSKGKQVLNLFSYTGAFSVAAALGGALKVTSVDTSQTALSWLDRLLTLNGITVSEEKYPRICRDVFSFLSQEGKEQESYDLLICDPPAFAKKIAHKEEASKAYIRLNRLALSTLTKGAIFITSSCSGIFSTQEFQDLIRIAAGQSKRELVLLKSLVQPFDHTVSFGFPEGGYLKTFVGYVREILPG